MRLSFSAGKKRVEFASPNMKRIGFILLVCLILWLAASLRDRSPQTTAQSSDTIAEVGTLKWYADLAKAKGKRQTNFDAGFENYAVARSLSEAVPYYSIVRVKLINSTPEILDSKQIETWWRFSLLEILSEQQIVDCNTCGQLRTPPPSVSQSSSGEVLVPKKGGTVTVDGIRLISSDHQIPAFEPSHEYLLFLSLDASRKIGNLGMGPAGVYGIKPDGTVEPVVPQPYEIWREIQSRYGASLERLRTHFHN